MLKIGLTGGLASGKSFVGAVLQRLGCKLIEADALGHQGPFLPGGGAYAGVVKEFGRDILNPDQTIDRKKLALKVFSNKEKLALLNSLVHPEVRRETDDLMAGYFAADPNAIVVVEAAIHIETGGYKRFDRLILVVCEERQQIERAMARGATRPEAMARLASQMSLAEKRRYADYVIDTSKSEEDTLRQTRDVYSALRSLKL